MVEDLKEAPKPENPPAKKGGLMKMIIMGVSFLILTGLVSVGTVFIIGTDEAVVPVDSAAVDTTTKTAAVEPSAHEEALQKKVEPLSEVMQNLAILDYVPGPTEVTTKDGSMLIQDSVDAMTWILQEKEKLAGWRKQIEVKQRELDELDKKVSQKLLKIEQVETARVAQLAKLYDGMQAAAVAQLLANLDDKTVVDVIPKMSTKQASAVLALMPPARAAKLSKQMMTIADNQE